MRRVRGGEPPRRQVLPELRRRTGRQLPELWRDGPARGPVLRRLRDKTRGVDRAPSRARRGARRAAQPLQLGDERRKATVLFADLSGYTAVAENMDPEATKALVRAARRAADGRRRFRPKLRGR